MFLQNFLYCKRFLYFWSTPSVSSYLDKKKLIHEFKICENFHPVVFMYMKKASLCISKLEKKTKK